MKVQPKTEAEITAANLIPAGEYMFEVIEATEKTSKNGNDMIALKLSVHADDYARGVFDYLVDIESMAYKIRHFADATGLLPQYEAGQLSADDMIGVTGKCKIAQQPEKDGYPAKNVVKDYVKRPAGAAAVKKSATAEVADDDIPF